MATHIRFNDDDDDVNEYNPTDSEDELPAKEKELLKKARSKGAKYSDSEDEVFGVYEESEESDSDKSDLALSDVEGQGEDDDGIPDSKAWGKNKKHYYSTDYVDQDYGGFQGTDGTLAELEEQEAKNLQSELAKNLDDDDFALDFAPKELEEEEEIKERSNVIKTDVSQLSKRQKLQLLMKESPELFGLIDDYKNRMTIVTEELDPVIKFYKEGKIKKSEAMDFVNSYCQLILNYTINISMYLLLKAKKTSVKNHPIIKRLYQYRKLLAQMDPVFEDQIKPQFNLLLEKAENQPAITAPTSENKKKLLNILKSAKDGTTSTSNKRKRGEKEPKSILKHQTTENEAHSDKHITFAPADAIENDSESDSETEKLPADMNELAVDDENEENGEVEGDVNSKRGITYQIAKNKGLMPSRKKEQRNPRVKHRNKFRKAKIRRKGAVREVRHELSRYGGEISGIKASVSKSIKLKS